MDAILDKYFTSYVLDAFIYLFIRLTHCVVRVKRNLDIVYTSFVNYWIENTIYTESNQYVIE